ncbi:sigma-54-dependent transcriptional regulator [Candidatus Laterigemmans baculatus]|uniref:sigma-54-dependent transcriptional regulator n=1 Tax=Candidatus Laterigemmans baculatus TaxID=2770505 RepID=UPI0013DC6177|nr:sigma-54 dependent transcriptional regulator [Candidatus Laterigemmans baculatus]
MSETQPKNDDRAEADSPLQPGDFSVLVVDNDPAHARAMTESLERVGYRCHVATTGPEGAKQIERETFDLVITDMVMNEVDGMQILKLARQNLPESEVVMVTGHATVPKAVEAMQQGAFNFLEKPITPQRLRAVTEKAAEAVRLRRQNTELHQRLDERFGFEGIIYASAKMQTVIDRLKRIAPTDATVLITGESGTGKELIAQAIHQNSPRKAKRMVALNTRAVSETLVESELFGHVRGAFTDAASDRVGAFEYANGGTLFLDEVGDMPMATQIKLLRVLEEHQIQRVGDNKPIKVNVRLVSATNRPLETMVEAGEFRNDLYFRLKVVTIVLPPLRERRDDIIPLMDHFRKIFLKRHGKPTAHFTPAVTKRFFGYDWPGNIRQLRNFVETLVVLDTDGQLDIDDLPPELSEDEGAAEPQEMVAAGSSEMSLLGRPLADIEKWAIQSTLTLTGGNREEAAKILGIGARTLYRRLDQYKKDDGEEDDGGEVVNSAEDASDSAPEE